MTAKPDLAVALSEVPERRAAPAGFDGRLVTRVHFGNEFCDRLIPSPARLQKALDWAQSHGLTVSLATPGVTEDGLAQLCKLFPLLPEKSEVIVNDWGTARLLCADFPTLEPVAGRQLCKMIKDPRLPSRSWRAVSPPGMRAGAFQAVLDRLGIRRLEADVPPLAAPEDFAPLGKRLSVHAAIGYATKGRVCKIGALARPRAEKFTAGLACRRECLTFAAAMDRRAATADEPPTFQRGNTVFYHHTPAMTEALHQATQRGWVDRIIIPGDWHGHHRAD